MRFRVRDIPNKVYLGEGIDDMVPLFLQTVLQATDWNSKILASFDWEFEV